MNIPDEAVEAASKGAWTADRPSDARKWDVVSKIEKDAYRAVARAALEAAAPLLMAQALRDSADDFKGEDLALDVILAGPDAVRHHLNSRADELAH